MRRRCVEAEGRWAKRVIAFTATTVAESLRGTVYARIQAFAEEVLVRAQPFDRSSST